MWKLQKHQRPTHNSRWNQNPDSASLVITIRWKNWSNPVHVHGHQPGLTPSSQTGVSEQRWSPCTVWSRGSWSKRSSSIVVSSLLYIDEAYKHQGSIIWSHSYVSPLVELNTISFVGQLSRGKSTYLWHRNWPLLPACGQDLFTQSLQPWLSPLELRVIHAKLDTISLSAMACSMVSTFSTRKAISGNACHNSYHSGVWICIARLRWQSWLAWYKFSM